MGVALVPPLDRLQVAPAQFEGDGAGPAAADGAVVDLRDGGHLGRRAGHEDLVRGVELIPGGHHLLNLQAHLAGDLQDAGAGDPHQVDGGGDDVEAPVADEEDVLP
jgi:hypothetical protein